MISFNDAALQLGMHKLGNERSNSAGGIRGPRHGGA
jgi:hypothetical protein